MLAVKNLHFEYAEKPVLSNVDFTIDKGSLLHIKGANGAGKSTLLKLLAGILPLQKGSISFQGQSVTHDMASYQRQLNYLGHKSGISQQLTPLENCRFDLSRVKTMKEVVSLLQRFSLEKSAHIPCGLLSAGQRRRVGLIRLLISNALVWLLDEPLVALDRDGVALLGNCINEHLAKGGIIILSSHQLLPETNHLYQEYHL